jgi:hypothetical protein
MARLPLSEPTIWTLSDCQGRGLDGFGSAGRCLGQLGPVNPVCYLFNYVDKYVSHIQPLYLHPAASAYSETFLAAPFLFKAERFTNGL